MRVFAIIPLTFVTAGCLAPGERDPTRYPWGQRPKDTYCIVSLETPGDSGIVMTPQGKSRRLACSPPPPRRRG